MLTRQRLTAILKRAGLKASKYHASGQVKGWGRYSEGYSLTVVETNERYAQLGTPSRPRWGKVSSDVVGYTLKYRAHDSIMRSGERAEKERAEGLERVKASLRDASVPFEEKGDELFVPAPPLK